MTPILRVGAFGSGLLLTAIIALVFIASRQVQDISQTSIGTYKTQTLQFMQERLESETAILAERISNEFEALSEWPNYLSRTVLDNRLRLTREELVVKAQNVLISAEGLNSVYIHMEPNGFSDRDLDYIGREFSSEEGALEIYWLRDNDGIRFEETPNSSVKYDETLDPHGQAVSFWYLCPKRKQKTCLSLPYTWTLLDGTDVELMSLSQPIMRDDRFVGISGGDINLTPLESRFRDLSKLLFSGQVHTALISRQGRVIVATEQAPDIGSNLTVGMHSEDDKLTVVTAVNVLNQEFLMVAQLSTSQVNTALNNTATSIVTSSRRATLTLIAIAAGMFILTSAFALRYVYDREQRIQRNEVALKRINANLEATVDEKTKDLQATVLSLKEAQDELIETGKIAALGRLVAGVSHELNTPLGNVLMAASQHQADLARLQRQVGEGLQRNELDRYLAVSMQSLEIVMRNADKAATLVRSFKEIAADQHSMRFKEFSLEQLINDVLLVLKPTISQHKVKVILSGADNIKCAGFPGALEQVLINLIQNALRHAFVAGEDKTIYIDITSSETQLVMAVKDNGSGIDANDLPHIFEPFFTTKMGAGGTGLGLSIVYNLVTQQLQGKITVVSEARVGTTFTLVMPRKLSRAGVKPHDQGVL